MNESESETAAVPPGAQQAESGPAQWAWVDREAWTERMLAALGNGVKGNKGFSLIDKVYRPGTLQAAWQQVKANKGSAGIDRQSIEAFARMKSGTWASSPDNWRKESTGPRRCGG